MKTFLYHVQINVGATDFWMIATSRDRQGAGFHRKNAGISHAVFFEDPDRLEIEIAPVPGNTDRR